MSTTSLDIEVIKRLREETGAGVMDVRRALQESNGDADKAKKLLEQWGAASAEKRAERSATQGVVDAYIHHGGDLGVLVEIDCETDFVARTPEFRELAHEIAIQVASANPIYVSQDDIPEPEAAELRERFAVEAKASGKPEQVATKIAEGKFKAWAKDHVLLDQVYVRDSSKTIRDLVRAVAASTRENVVVKRFARFKVGA